LLDYEQVEKGTVRVNITSLIVN